MILQEWDLEEIENIYDAAMETDSGLVMTTRRRRERIRHLRNRQSKPLGKEHNRRTKRERERGFSTKNEREKERHA